MATSSIIENIRVNNPKALEDYINHMEESSNNIYERTDDMRSGVVTDIDRMKSFMSKALAKKGISI